MPHITYMHGGAIVAVLFCDILDFHSIVSKLAPTDLVTLLDRQQPTCRMQLRLILQEGLGSWRRSEMVVRVRPVRLRGRATSELDGHESGLPVW